MKKRNRRSLWALTLTALILWVSPLAAQPLSEEETFGQSDFAIAAYPEEAVVTRHRGTFGGRAVAYTATAELMPLFDGRTGNERGRLFYVAYQAEGIKRPEVRPITFIYNGGPGSPSLWLHMGALGPKRAPVADDGLTAARPPFVATDNGESLLDLTDLVFIDPIGTGFSQTTPPGDDEAGRDFWGVWEDVQWVGEFIRLFLSRQDRWLSPVFLIGESYGGMRSCGLASHLQDIGIEPSGIVLIAPAISYGDLESDSVNDRPFIHALPTMAATAWYHGRLSSALQALPVEAVAERARAFASGPYREALWQGAALTEKARAEIAQGLAELTGLPESLFLRRNLRLDIDRFAGDLLGETRRFVSLYDGRLTGHGFEYRLWEDPLMARTGTAFVTTFQGYLQQDLQYLTDWGYKLSGNEAFQSWNWLSGTENGFRGSPNTVRELELAMRRNPWLKVFVAMGQYDLVCPADSITYSLSRVDLAGGLDPMTFRTYPAGHMMYLHEESLKALKKDLAAFYGEVLNP
jgi:carboxypeptidase C (cathepsin A)